MFTKFIINHMKSGLVPTTQGEGAQARGGVGRGRAQQEAPPPTQDPRGGAPRDEEWDFDDTQDTRQLERMGGGRGVEQGWRGDDGPDTRRAEGKRRPSGPGWW